MNRSIRLLMILALVSVTACGADESGSTDTTPAQVATDAVSASEGDVTPDGEASSEPTDTEVAPELNDAELAPELIDSVTAPDAEADGERAPERRDATLITDTATPEEDTPSIIEDTGAPEDDTSESPGDTSAPIEDAQGPSEEVTTPAPDSSEPAEDTLEGDTSEDTAEDAEADAEQAPPLPNSCQGACGGASADGSCFCNPQCIGNDTCCEDVETFCLELPCGCPASKVCLTGSMMPGAPPTTMCQDVCSFANGGCGALECETTALGALCLCPDNATWNDEKCISFQGEKCHTPGDDNCNGVSNENCPGQKSAPAPIAGCVCNPPFVSDGEGACVCPVGSIAEGGGCACTAPFVSTDAGGCACPEGLFLEGESCVEVPTPDPLTCGVQGTKTLAAEGTLPCSEGTEVAWDLYAIEVVSGDCVHVVADNGASTVQDPTEPLAKGADLLATLIDAEGVLYGLSADYAQLDDETTCSLTPWFEGAQCPEASVIAASSGELIVGIAQWGGAECAPEAPYTLHIAVNGVDVDLSQGPTYQGQLTVLPQFQPLPIVLEKLGTHTTLLEALNASDVDLSAEGPLTLFAPSDEAIEAWLITSGVDLDTWLDSDGLEATLRYHAAEGMLGSESLSDGQVITTLSGESLTLSVAEGVVSINDGAASVLTPDVEASNGVLHVIDSVLVAPAP